MTERRTLVYFIFLFSFLLLGYHGFSQVTVGVSNQKLRLQKVQELFEVGQYDQVKAEVEFLLSAPEINGVFTSSEVENLQYLNTVSGLIMGSYSSAQDAILFLKKAESKFLSAQLAYYLAHYFFELSKFEEALIYLEQTDALFLTNEQNERVQFEKGVSYFSQKKFANASPYFRSLLQLKSSIYNEDVNYYLGFIFFAEKKYKDALGLFLNVIKSNKYQNVVPFYLSFIYHQLGDQKTSLQYGEAYLKGGDAYYKIEILQLLGSLYYNNGNIRKSTDVYEKLINEGINLNNLQKFELGTGYFIQSNFSNAIKQLKPLSAQTDSIGLNAMYILAQSYLGVNQKTNARSSFGYCIAGKISEPKLELALFYFAKLSFELRYEDQAINSLNSFINKYPTSKFNDEANTILFKYYAKTNNFKRAIDFLSNNSLSSTIDNDVKARVYFGRGMEFINDLDYQQADLMMSNAIQFRDKNYYGPSLFWRGELAYRREKYDDAIGYFITYLNSGITELGNANETNALYSIGYAYFEKEEYNKALSYFEKININAANQNSEVEKETALLIADCYFMQKNNSKAKFIYNKIYQLGREGADYALFQLSLIEGIQSPSGKIKLLKEAEKRFPDSDYRPLIFMELADTYLSEEQYELAIPYLKRIPQMVDKDDEMVPDAMLKLGIAFYNMNQPQEAINRFGEIISTFPSTIQSSEALENAKVLFIEQGKIDDYEQFLKNSGKSLSSIQKDSLRFQVVQSALAAGDILVAKQSMNQYLSDFPTGLFAVEVQYLLAELYVDEKDWKNAAISYENLAQRGPSNYQEKALRQAAKLYFFELREYEKSANLFQQLAGSSQKSEIVLEALRGEVRSRFYLKQWMVGVRSAEKLLVLSKANPDDISYANIILGYFAQTNNELEKSSSYFQLVIDGNQFGLAEEARFQLIWNTIELGNLEQAEILATKSIESSGSNEYWTTKCYILLGKIFYLQKDIFNAKATLNSIIENSTIQELKLEAEHLLETVVSSEKIESK